MEMGLVLIWKVGTGNSKGFGRLGRLIRRGSCLILTIFLGMRVPSRMARGMVWVLVSGGIIRKSIRASGWVIRGQGMECRIISAGLSSIKAAGLTARNTGKGNSSIKMGGWYMMGDSNWMYSMGWEAIGMVRA
jgi:hypothetical protein